LKQTDLNSEALITAKGYIFTFPCVVCQRFGSNVRQRTRSSLL